MKIEPPGRTRVERILGACRARFERLFCGEVTGRLSAESTAALGELVKGTDGFLQELKSDPGRLGLETLLEEIVKLRRAKALGLPADLFGGFSDRLVAGTCDGLAPVGFRGERRAGAADAGGRAGVVTDRGDHRRPGGSADRFGVEDQYQG
jgi:hypothetical protein